MRRAGRIFSLLLLHLCVVYLYFVRQMDVGTLLDPGPGFMPAVVGVMGLVTSTLIFMGSLKAPAAAKPPEGTPKDGILRFAVSVAAIAVCIPLFQVLGAMLTIFFVVFLMNKILGAKGWLQPFVLASACSVITYVVFVLLLDVPLPRGIL